MRKAVALVVFVMLVGCLGWAQQQQPSPSPSQPSQPQPRPSPNIPTQPSPTDPSRQPGLDQRDPFGQRGRGVAGKIIPAPTQRLRIDLYLDGIRLDTAYTEMDGSFRFERQQPGRRYEFRVDIGPGVEYVEEMDTGLGFPLMLHIRQQGIRRAEFSVERGGEKGGGTMISLASLNVPKNAAKEMDKGREARQKKKFDEAVTRLKKATELYPQYAEAFNELGLVYRQQNQPAEARQAFEQAIAADPVWLGAYISLASLQLAENKPQELLDTTTKVLKLDPRLASALFFHSVANFGLGRLDEAEQSALQVDKTEHQQQFPQVHLLLGRIYMQKGNQAEAAKQLRTFLKEMPNAPNAAAIKAELEKMGHAQ